MRSLGESSHAKTRRREGVFLFQGIPKYDHPHLNVTKALVGITREKIETIVRPVYVSAAVTIGEFERSAPGWQPPDWGFDSGCEEWNDLSCSAFPTRMTPPAHQD